MMIKIFRIIDKFIGKFIILILSVLKIKTQKEQKSARKILVIKLWAIGDSILSLSLSRGIKEKFPSAYLDVLSSKNNKAVFESYNFNKTYSVGLFGLIFFIIKNFRKYDIVFDCEPYFNISAIAAFFTGKEKIGFSDQTRSQLYNRTVKFRKDQHMVQNYLDMLRVLGKEYDTAKLEKLNINTQDQTFPYNFLSSQMPDKKTLVGISPGVGSSSKNRMWYEERFATLADKIIKELNYQVIFIDSKENRYVVNKILSLMKHQPINAAGKFTLKETFYLISKCDIFISNDTGPMHIAAAQGCKTIGLFGPNTPVLWAPYGKGNISIYKTTLEPAIQNDKGIFKEGNREEYMGVIEVEDLMPHIDCMYHAG